MRGLFALSLGAVFLITAFCVSRTLNPEDDLTIGSTWILKGNATMDPWSLRKDRGPFKVITIEDGWVRLDEWQSGDLIAYKIRPDFFRDFKLWDHSQSPARGQSNEP